MVQQVGRKQENICVVVWANPCYSHITGNNVQKLETIYSSDVTALLQSALGAEQNAFSQYFSSEAPQVSVLFLADSKPTQMPSLQVRKNLF